MKNKLEIFKKAQDLLDELVDFKFEKTNNKELIMLDMIREVIKGCNAMEKEQLEHKRFGFEAPNYAEAVSNLKSFILEMCKDNKIYL
jgi:hypothetical protein